MPLVDIKAKGSVFRVEAAIGETLLQVMQASGADVSFPCGGNHTCGKCLVRAAGAVSPAEGNELDLLEDKEPGLRLACFCRVAGDCSVALPEQEAGDRISMDFRAGERPLQPIYDKGYGAAVDIGTTTVVAYLFRHDSREPIGVEGALNRQQAFGADVLSRIDYCNSHGVEQLSQVIREQISLLLLELCRRAEIGPEQLRAICITGNTTMLHIAAALPPRTLALAPFTPVSLFDSWDDFVLPGFPAAHIYLPPCISAYIGADITCSILASGIVDRPEQTLLVDIGTNGEMGLKMGDRLICCSTAAGPAFEGAGISAGMTAKSGAINKVWAQEGKIGYTTIDQAPAAGICGSGLIDAVCALLELGLVNKTGRMDKSWGGKAPLGDSGVFITQGDVRQLQLAKGAIRAGVDTLLHECERSYADLAGVVLCGGFGSFLDPLSAGAIGLIPPELAARTAAIGNAAGAGAGRILQSRAEQEQARAIAALAEPVELSYSQFFRNQYIQAMAF